MRLLCQPRHNRFQSPTYFALLPGDICNMIGQYWTSGGDKIYPCISCHRLYVNRHRVSIVVLCHPNGDLSELYRCHHCSTSPSDRSKPINRQTKKLRRREI